MSYKIFNIEDIQLDNFIYQSPKKINMPDKKCIFIPLVYKENEKILPILFQLPSIKLNDSYKKDSLLVPLNAIKPNKTEILIKLLNDIDEKIIQDFKNHGKKWCKEMAENLKNIEYKALVNDIDDNDLVYDNGVLNLQLNDINNYLFNKNIDFNIKIFNEKKEQINEPLEDVLIKGNIIQCIIELKGLIILLNHDSNEIFPLIKTHQIRYFEEKVLDINLDNYSFLDSEVEPKKIVSNPVASMNKIKEASEEIDELDELDDSSDEYSDSSDEDSESSDDEILKRISKEKSSSEDKNLKRISKEDSSSEDEISKKFFNMKSKNK
jgi:hypothetical protein